MTTPAIDQRAAKRAPAAPIYLDQARQLLSRRRSAEALQLLRKGLTQQPCDEAALLLAKALVTVSRLREARTVLETELTVLDPPAYSLLVRVCLALQDVTGALSVARFAVDAHPKEESLRELKRQAEAELAATGVVPTISSAAAAVSGQRRGRRHAQERYEGPAVVKQRGSRGKGGGDSEADQADRKKSTRAKGDFGPLLGPPAPSLEAAVKRFVNAANPANPRTQPLFSGLLGEGPPLPKAKAPEPVSSEEAPEERTALRVSPEPRTSQKAPPSDNVVALEQTRSWLDRVRYSKRDKLESDEGKATERDLVPRGERGDQQGTGGRQASSTTGDEVSARELDAAIARALEAEEQSTALISPSAQLLAEASGDASDSPDLADPGSVPFESETRATIRLARDEPASGSSGRREPVGLDDPTPSYVGHQAREETSAAIDPNAAMEGAAASHGAPEERVTPALLPSATGPHRAGPQASSKRGDTGPQNIEVGSYRRGDEPTYGAAEFAEGLGDDTDDLTPDDPDEEDRDLLAAAGLDDSTPSGEDFLGSVGRLREERPTLDLRPLGPSEASFETRAAAGAYPTEELRRRATPSEVAQPPPRFQTLEDEDYEERFDDGLGGLGELEDDDEDEDDDFAIAERRDFRRDNPTIELRRRPSPTPSEIALPRGDGSFDSALADSAPSEPGQRARRLFDSYDQSYPEAGYADDSYADAQPAPGRGDRFITADRRAPAGYDGDGYDDDLDEDEELPTIERSADAAAAAVARARAARTPSFELPDPPALNMDPPASLIDNLRAAPTSELPSQGGGLRGAPTYELPGSELPGSEQAGARAVLAPAVQSADLVPIAAVKISRPNEPTEEGYRLAVRDELLAPPPREIPELPTLQRAPLLRRPSGGMVAARKPVGWWRRHWAVTLGLCLAVLAGGAVFGLFVRQRSQGEHHLAEARALADRDQAWTLRSSLEHVRQAATLSGRNADVVALAARIHARLAFEFGESSLARAASLVEESKRLGAPYKAGPRRDLAMAQAYLHLATKPLPQALAYLDEARKEAPEEPSLVLLHAEAQMRAGQHERAAKLLDGLPGNTARVVRAKAQLAWRRGFHKQARDLLRRAVSFGLSLQQVDLDLARFGVWDGTADDRVLHRLRALAGDKDLSAAERSWALLLSAAIHRRQGRLPSAAAALKRSLAKQPVADPDYHALASRELLAANEQKRARREADQALNFAPRNPRFRRMLARVELAMDRPARVIELLGTASAPADQVLLIAAHLRRGDVAKARALREKLPAQHGLTRQLVTARLLLAEGNPYQVVRELSGLPTQQRDNVEVEVLRGLAALQAGELQSAERYLKHALALHQRHPEGLWALGRLHEVRGEAQAAKLAYEQAVAANGYRMRTRLDCGRLLARLGLHSAAEKQYAAVLTQESQNPMALAGRARARVELQRKDATADLQALREHGQRDMAGLLTLRQAMLAGRYPVAMQLFKALPESWLRDDPEARLWQAELERRLGHAEGATAIYRALLGESQTGTLKGPTVASAPSSLTTSSSVAAGTSGAAQVMVVGAAHLGLAELAFAAGRTKVALTDARAAVDTLAAGSIYPRDLKVRARLLIARCQRKVGAVGAAIAELQEVLELSKQSYEANLELGRIYLTLKKPLRAVGYLAAAAGARLRDRVSRDLLQRACRPLASPQPAACRTP